MSGVAHVLKGAAAGILAAVLLFSPAAHAHKVHDPVAGTAPSSYACPAGMTLQDFYVNANTAYRSSTPDGACFAWGDAQSPASHGHITYTHSYVAASGSSTTGKAGTCNVYWNPFGEHGGNLNASSDIRYQCAAQPTCTIPAGTEYGSYTVPVDPNNTQTITHCYNQCKHTGHLIKIDGVGSLRRWVSTGSLCTADPPMPADEPTQSITTTDPPSTKDAVCKAGTSSCVAPTEKNCGIVNGEYRCLGTEVNEQNPCVTAASGAMFCIGTAPNPPDNGTPGSAATPDSSFDGLKETPSNQNGATLNYYSATTVQNSTNYSDGDGNGDGEGSCGGLSQPDCRVRINEAGTPTSAPSVPSMQTYSADRQAETDQGISQATGDGAQGEEDARSDLQAGVLDKFSDLSESNTCEQITGTFMGHAFSFPGPNGCEKLQQLRSLLAWVFAAYTVIVLFEVATAPKE